MIPILSGNVASALPSGYDVDNSCRFDGSSAVMEKTFGSAGNRKTLKKEIIKNQASGLLTPTDWYVLKATDVAEYSVPSAVSIFRADVRTRSNEMETAIDNSSDVDALATLYTYVNTGTEENPVYERPLGEFPTLEI